ncbi:MAG: nucleotidyl transferase AbiEii/AbiGii toxin family protein [Proteobacteria bacterium]|nr:nucleotidyl transferase AbiEii/AbiGii toxin family protein [Pseudomonadota bacterium]
MNHAIAAMLKKYNKESINDHTNALREIIQEIALCGLWRGKFFEKAAFYGGTALRVLHGLDRFSEDMDFSLLATNRDFNIEPYCDFIEKELRAFGFTASVQKKQKTTGSAIESAFLKANTREQLLIVETTDSIVNTIPKKQLLNIKLEVDTDPPSGFSTESKYCLLPMPFSVKVYTEPSLFAGKMHALLCRKWKRRVKGRDWYDFVWYVSRETALDLNHLQTRMVQSGHWNPEEKLAEPDFRDVLAKTIDRLDIAQARSDVQSFIRDPSRVDIWSKDFFRHIAGQVKTKT